MFKFLFFSFSNLPVPVDQTVELHNQIHLLKIQHHEQLEQLKRERKCLPFVDLTQFPSSCDRQ